MKLTHHINFTSQRSLFDRQLGFDIYRNTYSREQQALFVNHLTKLARNSEVTRRQAEVSDISVSIINSTKQSIMEDAMQPAISELRRNLLIPDFWMDSESRAHRWQLRKLLATLYN